MGKSIKGKSLGEGIRQRANGSYEARYIDGNGKRVSVYGKTQTEVKHKLEAAIYRRDHPPEENEDITLDEWYETWISSYKYGLRPNTVTYYSQVYRLHVKPVLGDKKLYKIRQTDILKALIDMVEVDGLGFETVDKSRAIIRDMMDKAVNNGILRRNPAQGVKTPIKNEDSDVRVLNREEQVSFFNAARGTWYYNLFVVAVNTGMRIGELGGLRWDDIDWDANLIRVDRTLTYLKKPGDTQKRFHLGPPKTKQSKRVIPITEECAKALKAQYVQKFVARGKAIDSHKAAEGFEDQLFVSKYDTPILNIDVNKAIHRILDELNLCRSSLEKIEYFSTHCFRHTFATRCFEAGMSPKTVQTILGHATLSMTMDLYTFCFDEQKKIEIQRLSEQMKALETEDLDEKRFEKLTKRREKVVNFGG